MIVWMVDYTDFPQDEYSSRETLGVFSSIEKVRECFSSIEFLDASTDNVLNSDPDHAYMGFDQDNKSEHRYYNANYWVSKWELDTL